METQWTTAVLSRCAVMVSLVMPGALRSSAVSADDLNIGTAARPRPIRRIVVSIPDCKLALIENDRVVRVYSVAVGADESPTPFGTFTIVNRVSNPTYYRRGTVIPDGERAERRRRLLRRAHV